MIDEAHNLLSRVRDMLSGSVDGGRIRKLRTVVGKTAGRKHPLYKAMTGVLKAIDDLPIPEDEAMEGVLEKLPTSFDNACMELADAFMEASNEHFTWGEEGEQLRDTLMPLLSLIRARKRDLTEYAWLWQVG